MYTLFVVHFITHNAHDKTLSYVHYYVQEGNIRLWVPYNEREEGLHFQLYESTLQTDGGEDVNGIVGLAQLDENTLISASFENKFRPLKMWDLSSTTCIKAINRYGDGRNNCFVVDSTGSIILVGGKGVVHVTVLKNTEDDPWNAFDALNEKRVTSEQQCKKQCLHQAMDIYHPPPLACDPLPEDSISSVTTTDASVKKVLRECEELEANL